MVPSLYMKKVIQSALVLLFTLVVSNIARGEPTVNTTRNHYEVFPSSTSNLHRELAENSPIKTNGRAYIGHTRWHIKWEYYWENRNGGCNITSVKTSLEITYTMPQISQRHEISKPVRQAFEIYYASLMAHEKEHMKSGLFAAREIEDSLSKLRTSNHCENIEEAVNATTKKYIEKYIQRDRDLDREISHELIEFVDTSDMKIGNKILIGLAITGIILIPFAIKGHFKRKEKRFAVYRELGLTLVSPEEFKQWIASNNFISLNLDCCIIADREILKGRYKGHDLVTFVHVVYKSLPRNKQHHVTIFELDNKFPQFLLRAEHLGDQIKTLFGGSDIDFDDDEPFSKKYYLVGRSEEETRKVFDKSFRNMLIQKERFWIESDGNKLLILKYNAWQEDDSNLSDFLNSAIEMKNILERKVTQNTLWRGRNSLGA